MSAGSKNCDGQENSTCAVMETSMLEEEDYFNPPTSSEAGTSVAKGKKLLENLCRVCAHTSDYFIPIFENEGIEHQLDMKIHQYLPIQLIEADGLPTHLCLQCASTLIAWHDLVTACVEADKRLHLLLLQADDDNEGHEEEVIQYYDPPVDSDGGEEISEPSTSATVVPVKESSPSQKRRTAVKVKQQRKAHENTSSESNVKSGAIPVAIKDASTTPKEMVESSSSAERSSSTLKIVHPTSHATLIKEEEIDVDSSREYEDEENDNEYILENSNTDVGNSAVWFPNIHSYCKPGNTKDENVLASEEQLLRDSDDSKMVLTPNVPSILKSRKRVKPHIIELESFGFPVKTEMYDTNIFMCDVCGESILGEVSDMEEHLMSHCAQKKRRKHSENEQYESAKNDSINSNIGISRERDGFPKLADVYCEACRKCFESNLQLKFHNKKYHSSSSQQKSENHHGSNCGNEIVIKKVKHKNVFMCRGCKTEFPDLASFKQHRPAQAKKVRFGEMVRNACTGLLAIDMKVQKCKQKYLNEICEQTNVRKISKEKKMVRDACGELLSVDLVVENYLLKQLHKEKQQFRVKYKRKWCW